MISRSVRFAPILSFAMLAAMTACQSGDQLLSTPTKTPAPLVTANSGQVQQGGGQPTPALFFTPVPEEVIIDVGPDTLPPNTNPLTGLPVDDVSTIERRPVAVAVSNSPPEFTRPQAGLGAADIVYEYFTEGGVTRYTAIFLSQAPEFVGSVRSCRLIMLELSLMYDTLWTCSGYSIGVGELVRASPNYYLLIDGTFRGEPYLRRINDEDVAVTGSSPHNLFAVPEEVWLWAEEREYNIRPNVTGIAYRTMPPDGGVVATRVTVDYRGAGFRPRWDYDPSTRTYLRFDEGQPYDDKLTGEQLRFDNVLIIAAPEIITDIQEDSSGARALEQRIYGEGPLTLFRDGMRYEGIWQRANRNDNMTYFDLDGNVLALRPGTTWVQVVPLFFERLIVEP